jgi:TonB family protein
MTISGRQSRSPDKLWFGDGQLRVARVRGTNKSDGSALTLDDVRFDWRTVDRPKAIDMAFQYRIGAIEAAGEKVEDVRFDVRMVNIDRASMVALQAASERQRKQLNAMTPEQQEAAIKPLLLGFGKSAIVRGSALEIDEISARYRGNKASIHGRIGLAGAVESDLQDMKKLVKKIVARFEIRVPVAMVRDVAGVIAARQAAQQGAAPNPMGAAQVGQTMTDVVIGKLVGGGFARVENEVLVSNLEFRNGELTANGKKIELPKPAAATPPVAAQGSSLPPNALKARRIEESCRLPEFPDEVLAQDKPLRAAFSWRVDPEGKVENLRVTAPSGYPAWDQTMVAVLGQCRYIPALQDGKPVGLQINWNVARSAGGPRVPTPSP